MTITEFEAKWPHKINFKLGYAWTADCADFPDRWQAWRLTDYRVASVSGGTIRFSPIAELYPDPFRDRLYHQG